MRLRVVGFTLKFGSSYLRQGLLAVTHIHIGKFCFVVLQLWNTRYSYSYITIGLPNQYDLDRFCQSVHRNGRWYLHLPEITDWL